MNQSNVSIRSACHDDILEMITAHYSAVHTTAAKDYSSEICAEWSVPVSPTRVEDFKKNWSADEVILVACVNGAIAGFGSIIPASEELRAVYIGAEFGGHGVGSKLLIQLEKIAREKGCRRLQMHSSLTAHPFYLRHGYSEIRRAEHTLRSGRKMPSIVMSKSLSEPNTID